MADKVQHGHWGTYLSDWGHGELQRWARNGIAKVKLILLGETLVLDVGRSAVLGDDSIHRDVVCDLTLSDYDGFETGKICQKQECRCFRRRTRIVEVVMMVDNWCGLVDGCLLLNCCSS